MVGYWHDEKTTAGPSLSQKEPQKHLSEFGDSGAAVAVDQKVSSSISRYWEIVFRANKKKKHEFEVNRLSRLKAVEQHISRN